MIGYVTLGTNDFDKAVKFYDTLLAELGATRMMESDSFVAWTNSADSPGVCITKPFDGGEASVGNGVMVALQLDSNEKVDKLYAKAIELGATDEGPAGPRGDSGFYAGYFRDPDGNKFNAFCMGG